MIFKQPTKVSLDLDQVHIQKTFISSIADSNVSRKPICQPDLIEKQKPFKIKKINQQPNVKRSLYLQEYHLVYDDPTITHHINPFNLQDSFQKEKQVKTVNDCRFQTVQDISVPIQKPMYYKSPSTSSDSILQTKIVKPQSRGNYLPKISAKDSSHCLTSKGNVEIIFVDQGHFSKKQKAKTLLEKPPNVNKEYNQHVEMNALSIVGFRL